MLLGVFFGKRADGLEEGARGVVCGGAYCLGAGVGEGVPGATFDAAGGAGVGGCFFDLGVEGAVGVCGVYDDVVDGSVHGFR